MKISELKSNFNTALSELYPLEEIRSFLGLLSEEYLNLSKIEIALNPQLQIPKSEIIKFEDALLRLKKHEPIQYIIGKTEFFGLQFKVNEHTLIPRPETEELVDWILKYFDKKIKNLEVLDIGTGSGCIAISLAKHLKDAQVSALDISEKGLKTARINAKQNKAEVDFFETDILNAKSLPKQYDVIVSNPPYVRELEKHLMQNNVLNYEPPTALFVTNAEPLKFYKAIARLAKTYLKPHGTLFFEINEYLGKETASLLKDAGFQKIEIKKDLYGKDRMLKCSKNEKTR